MDARRLLRRKLWQSASQESISPMRGYSCRRGLALQPNRENYEKDRHHMKDHKSIKVLDLFRRPRKPLRNIKNPRSKDRVE